MVVTGFESAVAASVSVSVGLSDSEPPPSPSPLENPRNSQFRYPTRFEASGDVIDWESPVSVRNEAANVNDCGARTVTVRAAVHAATVRR
mmetsp:Transcript_668/g.792  ORF Transcript_668/g.792 Transcript_668/m.792 type:complete len:90 (+) Transcript_668:2-271(+)